MAVCSNSKWSWSDILGETGDTYQPPTYNTVGFHYFRRKATDLICGVIGYSNVFELEIVDILPLFGGSLTYEYPCVFQVMYQVY